MSKCFQSCCENCILRFLKKNLTSFFAEFAAFSPILSKSLSMFWQVKFHHCSQNNLQHVQRNNWRKKFFLVFSKFFLSLKDLFLQFCQKYFRRLVETEFYVSERTFRNFFLKNFWCCTVFGLKAEKFQQPNRKWPASLSSYLRCLPGNILRKNTFSWKLCCGIFSVEFWIIFLALLAVKFSRFIRIVCLRVRCTVCRLHFKNSWFFKNYWNWAETLKVFGSKYSPVLSKNQISCSKEKRREKSLLGNSQAFSNFEHINFLVVWQKLMSNVVKTAFNLSKKLIWGKKVLSKKM